MTDDISVCWQSRLDGARSLKSGATLTADAKTGVDRPKVTPDSPFANVPLLKNRHFRPTDDVPHPFGDVAKPLAHVASEMGNVVALFGNVLSLKVNVLTLFGNVFALLGNVTALRIVVKTLLSNTYAISTPVRRGHFILPR